MRQPVVFSNDLPWVIFAPLEPLEHWVRTAQKLQVAGQMAALLADLTESQLPPRGCNRVDKELFVERVLYTADAVVEGGRAGHGRTSDGRLDVGLSVPQELGGDGGPGTNPEQLFAIGYAACFESALLGVARGRGLDASDVRIASQVRLGPTGHGGFTLAVSLDLHAPHLSTDLAAELMLRAHERCPYSNATRNNIDVELKVDGALVDAASPSSIR